MRQSDVDRSPTILDGAMGTELARRGVDTGLPLWSANALLVAPDIVRQIHVDYVNARARVMTANTFRTNVRTLGRAGMHDRARELTFKAVQLARDAAAAASAGVSIAGSMAPLEDCYSPELVPQDDAVLLAEHSEMACNLADAGCDLLLIETMNTIREAVAAAQAASATNLPLWVSFVLGPDNRLLSGERLDDAIRALVPFGPQAVLVNCIPVAQVTSALGLLRQSALRSTAPIVMGAYANAGHVGEGGWSMEHGVAPQDYARAARDWLDAGAGIIGGCCGTTPDHIRALRGLIPS